MIYNIKAYISQFLAPLFYTACNLRQEAKTTSENDLEREVKKSPTIQNNSLRRPKYNPKTVSRTGGTRGRRG